MTFTFMVRKGLSNFAPSTFTRSDARQCLASGAHFSTVVYSHCRILLSLNLLAKNKAVCYIVFVIDIKHLVLTREGQCNCTGFFNKDFSMFFDHFILVFIQSIKISYRLCWAERYYFPMFCALIGIFLMHILYNFVIGRILKLRNYLI